MQTELHENESNRCGLYPACEKAVISPWFILNGAEKFSGLDKNSTNSSEIRCYFNNQFLASSGCS